MSYTYIGFDACETPNKHDVPPGERMDFYMVSCKVHGDWGTTLDLPDAPQKCSLCGGVLEFTLLPY